MRQEIIQDVERVLNKNNELIHISKTALGRMICDDYNIMIRVDKRPPGEHERRFNAPQIATKSPPWTVKTPAMT